VSIVGWRCTQYDGIVALAAARISGAAGVDSMIIVLLIAGIAFLLAGLLGIALGVPVKEFSFGNTMILAGVVSACTGMVTLALCVVVRELKNIAGRLGTDATAVQRAVFPTSSAGSVAPRDQAAENTGFLFSRDQPGAANPDNPEPAAPAAAPPPPWHEETATRDRPRSEAPAPAETALAARQRRNLLFSSTSRKERERGEMRITDPAAVDPHPAPAAAAPSKSSEAPSATFEDAWPQPERARNFDAPSQRRSGRTPSTFAETAAGESGTTDHAAAARSEDQPGVMVIKSGIVDGMAYSLYSDGSIEAQMPEGMMRFASIDELRAHLDQRP
jgi:hypothetical protein